MSERVSELVECVQGLLEVNERGAAELERLGKGIEKIVAKYGAEHPEVADALHRLLTGKA